MLGAVRHVVIMVKEPHPGRVKTRLGRDIGNIQAAWWFRHQSLGLIRRLSRDPRWQLWLAVAPDVEGLQSRIWPVNTPRVPQGRGDLGERMTRLFKALPPGPVVLVGADIPGIAAAHIWRAFGALGARDVVFGPAMDGGYWLVGLKRARAVPSGLFSGVRWSSEHALGDTVAGLTGVSVGYVDRLADVDRGADLKGGSPAQERP